MHPLPTEDHSKAEVQAGLHSNPIFPLKVKTQKLQTEKQLQSVKLGEILQFSLIAIKRVNQSSIRMIGKPFQNTIQEKKPQKCHS